MKEKDIQSAIMNMLLEHPEVAWAYVTSAGTVRGMGGGRPFNIGIPGMSDILGQTKDGRLLAIEVKQPGKRPTEKQLDFMEMVKDNKGVAFWATDVEQALSNLNNGIMLV